MLAIRTESNGASHFTAWTHGGWRSPSKKKCKIFLYSFWSPSLKNHFIYTNLNMIFFNFIMAGRKSGPPKPRQDSPSRHARRLPNPEQGRAYIVFVLCNGTRNHANKQIPLLDCNLWSCLGRTPVLRSGNHYGLCLSSVVCLYHLRRIRKLTYWENSAVFSCENTSSYQPNAYARK